MIGWPCIDWDEIDGARISQFGYAALIARLDGGEILGGQSISPSSKRVLSAQKEA